MKDEPVVTTKLDCFRPDGKRQEVLVEIGRPYLAPQGEWACPVKIRGLYENLLDIHRSRIIVSAMIADSFYRFAAARVGRT